MIPVKLSLEGIYSYQERQTIDFTHLTDGGLFGIFGAVASGKSTILEAISFALYGESDRMGTSNRAYNMMNLKSDRMYIEFDFLNFEKKKYRATREYRRNSKNFEKVIHAGTTFYEWCNENWIPLDHSNTESIIGLSAENFKRTIIIPQGKFKEFIELGGRDRTLMMKEIFNLHQFELSNSIKTLYGKNEEKLNTLLGQLSAYEKITEEAIKEKEEAFLMHKTSFDKQLAEHTKLSELFEQLKQLNVDFSNLQKQKVKLATEETNKKVIEELEKSLKLYVATHQEFDEKLRVKQQLSQKIIVEKKRLDNKQNELEANREKQIIVLEKLAALKPFMDNIDIKKEEVTDLEFISQIRANQEAIKKGEERTTKGRAVVEKLSEDIASTSKTISETDDKIETIKDQLIDANTLTSIQIWFATYNTLSKQLREKQSKLSSLVEDAKTIAKSFEDIGYSQNNWKATIDAHQEELNKQLSSANKKKTQLTVNKQIAHFANQIHDGEPCPLCGSHEHPHVIETKDVSAEIEANQDSLMKLEKEAALLAKKNTQLIQLQESNNNLNKIHQETINEIEKLQNDKKQHLSLFVWENFSSTDEEAFKKEKANNDKLINEKESLEKKQKTNRADLDKSSKKLNEAKDLLAKIEKENSDKETLIADYSRRIKHLSLVEFNNETVETINQTIAERKDLIKTKENEQMKLDKQKNDLLVNISAQKATIQSIEKIVEELSEEQLENQDQINAKLSASSFDIISEIELLLANKRDVEAERERIENFKINYAKLKQSIEELENRLKGKSFSIEMFEEKKRAFVESEKIINNLRETLATLKHELDRNKKEFNDKKTLLVEKEKLETRKANIATLTQLFKASGFVNYVSSIYLRNLCEIANKRFHRLTKNQLSLQMNDNNEFEIIDFLNNGRSRSVKTLSGGQSFQVSLSLALALAENVQSLTNSEKNFFFIDEGFGTQDAESVNIVFETLSNLQKENRIVGIISHVEELQERIPKSLYIEKDLERGSLLKTMN